MVNTGTKIIKIVQENYSDLILYKDKPTDDVIILKNAKGKTIGYIEVERTKTLAAALLTI